MWVRGHDNNMYVLWTLLRKLARHSGFPAAGLSKNQHVGPRIPAVSERLAVQVYADLCRCEEDVRSLHDQQGPRHSLYLGMRCCTRGRLGPSVTQVRRHVSYQQCTSVDSCFLRNELVVLVRRHQGSGVRNVPDALAASRALIWIGSVIGACRT